MRIRVMRIPSWGAHLFDPPTRSIDFKTLVGYPLEIEHWRRFKTAMYRKIAGEAE